MVSLALSILAAAGTVQAYTMINAGWFMRKNIDPIVIPGQYKSHMHSFFGSDAVTINTNSSAELQAGCHTNSNPNDFSVYWHPTLFAVDGDERVPIEARYFKAYYENIGDAEIPFPQDFKSLAGNALAKSQDDLDERWTINWWCEYGPDSEVTKDPGAFPAHGCNLGRLQVILRFPDCVDTNTLKYAYSGRQNLPNANRCPTDMKRIPQIRFSIRFDHSEALPNGWSGKAPLELACGPSYCFHGDFINGWLPEAAENMLTQATDKREFQSVTGPLSEQPACTAQDTDPDNGTSDYDESLTFLNAGASPSTNQTSSLTVAVALPTSATPVTLATTSPVATQSASSLDAKKYVRRRKRRSHY